ncbi:peptidoglycan DD-metalloendopeptidase family protein [Reyranella sp.]|uniref:M23 family metallopeptidase n=1 Tax=Reyranella sp. TaxID=1929291 RepID=UPI002730AFAF|nr:peptidoglycan DD-metalloendopeptidase family protein [Reyranella sp.]MDP2372153.1 peptidoglycan DD-metalloendopeptidase family protein [Reyranella sp.]
MLDQPSPRDSVLNPVDRQISPSPQPTFVQIRAPVSGGRAWPRFCVGLGGLAVVAALGWAVTRSSPEHAAPTEIAGPARMASALEAYPESETPMPEAAFLPPVLALESPPAPPASEDILAVSRDEPAPTSIETTSAETISAETPAIETLVRLAKGDTVARVLHRLGVATGDISNTIVTLAAHVRVKSLPIGQALTVRLRPADEAGAKAVLLALTIRPEPRREITLERDEEGDYSVEEEIFEVASKLQRASGEVDGSVIASAEAAGVPRRPLAEMLRAFSWDVNFQHDIKAGDRFDVLIERSWTSDGHEVDAGRVLWAELTTGGGAESFSLYRFKPADGEEFFYNREGESVVKALLRTPLNMSRISSRFGMRRHPVLRFTRLHAGVDFAAPPGTPILAAGAGQVVEAGRNGGYGRWVKILHRGGLATGYAHMSRIAPGVRRSARVRQGQVIGFVGSTGLSTGPHLHFELHRNGRPVNPLTMARTAERTRLAGKDLERFRARVAEIDLARETATVVENR